MVPTHVQQQRDGKWWPWTGGSVDDLTLRMRLGKGDVCYVNGVTVRALRFEGGRIWTPALGWQKEVQTKETR